jgi:hypothetical protein
MSVNPLSSIHWFFTARASIVRYSEKPHLVRERERFIRKEVPVAGHP